VEKHEVWQEFYAEHDRERRQPATTNKKTPPITELPKKNATPHPRNNRHGDVKKQLLKKVSAQKRLRDSHHVRAMVFGVGMGTLVVVILMFSFFNERFIAPFIRPSQNVSATPIIVDPNNSGPVGPEAKIIIPKINLEAPVIYDVPSIEEKDVQKGLENGVVHYITTPNPGEKGNSVIFGHSSSNILNKGKYKFAFILLKSLENGDTFIVQKDGKRYVYKVYNKFVTDPKDTSVLNNTDRPSTMTLITCDPPGTSTNRLIVQAEQIFPDPSTNKESSATDSSRAPEKLPSNSPTLWYRITRVFSN
jgi:sortase A